MDIAKASQSSLPDDHETHSDDSDKAVWVDSDDERITVSLASNPRLRKLRINESEDWINGKEYTKRLRRQFERLHPVPEWAAPCEQRQKRHKRRRRNSNSSDSSEERDSENDMSVDSDDLSAQHLAKLLQNPGSLTQPLPTDPNHKRKLRPEIIDMQRTKDVGVAQPVSSNIFEIPSQ